jgi:hypothetical protein
VTDGDILFDAIMGRLCRTEDVAVEAACLWDWLQEFVGDDCVVILRTEEFRLLVYHTAPSYFCVPYYKLTFIEGSSRFTKWKAFSISPLYSTWAVERIPYELKGVMKAWTDDKELYRNYGDTP